MRQLNVASSGGGDGDGGHREVEVRYYGISFHFRKGIRGTLAIAAAIAGGGVGQEYETLVSLCLHVAGRTRYRPRRSTFTSIGWPGLATREAN